MFTSIITSIIFGQLRHILSAIGGGLIAHAINIIAGLPQIHDLTTALVGGAALVTGATLSALHKVKTKSGPDYSGLNK